MTEPIPSYESDTDFPSEPLICKPLNQIVAQEKALRRQQALVKIANNIRRSLELSVICQTATNEVRALLEVDRVAIYRFNPDWSGDFTIESVAEGWKPLVGIPKSIEDTHLMETRGGRYANNETFAVPDIYQAGHAPCHITLLEEFQARAYAIAPIFQEDSLWGLLAAFQNTKPRQWLADEIQLLAQIGEQLGIALGQAQEQAQALRRQKALVKIASDIRRSLDLTTICQTATDEVRQLLDADRVAIYRFNQDWSGDFTIESVAGGWKPLAGMHKSIEDTHLMETRGGRYAKNETFSVPDIYQAGHTECHVALLEEFQARAYAIAPIFQDEQLWGLLAAFQNTEPRLWLENEVQLLAQIGEQLGIALQQAEYVSQVKAQSVELENLYQELKQSQIQLVQQEKMASLGELVAGVAHEINNPVNFIYGNVKHVEGYVQDLLSLINLYREHYTQPNLEIQEKAEEIDLDFLLTDLPKTLNSMEMGSERIRQIVLSLRNFSRLDEAEFKAVDIHEGIDNTLLILGHRVKGNDQHPAIKIIKQYAQLPTIECYPAQLNQVFMNLLVNAIDALEEAVEKEHFKHNANSSTPCIWISTQLLNPNQIEVRIRDNALGIPEALKSKIFNHFFTTKTVGKGTGLGLAIVQEIICTKHRGILRLDSEPGQGTEFILELPIKVMS